VSASTRSSTPSDPNRDANEVSANMLKDMDRRAKHWNGKVDKVYDNKVSAADVKASKDTAKAAQDASDAERGASAVAGLAKKQIQNGKIQADGVYARYKARHPGTKDSAPIGDPTPSAKADAEASADEEDEPMTKASKKIVGSQAEASKRAGSTYDKKIAKYLKSADVDGDANSASDSSQEESASTAHSDGADKDEAAKAAVKEAIDKLVAQGYSRSKAEEAIAEAVGNSDAVLLGVSASTRSSNRTSSNHVVNKMLKDMDQRAHRWEQRAAHPPVRVTKKDLRAVEATAKMAVRARDELRGAAGVAAIAERHSAANKEQAMGIWERYQETHPGTTTGLASEKSENGKTEQEGDKTEQDEKLGDAHKKVHNDFGATFEKEVSHDLNKAGVTTEEQEDGEDVSEDSQAPHELQKSAATAVSDAVNQVASGTQSSQVAAHQAVAHAAVAAAAVSAAITRVAEDTSSSRAEAQEAVASVASELPSRGTALVEVSAAATDVNGISSSGKSVTGKMLSQMEHRANKWVAKATYSGSKNDDRLTAKQIADADATAKAAAAAYNEEEASYAIAGLAAKSFRKGNDQSDAMEINAGRADKKLVKPISELRKDDAEEEKEAVRPVPEVTPFHRPSEQDNADLEKVKEVLAGDAGDDDKVEEIKNIFHTGHSHDAAADAVHQAVVKVERDTSSSTEDAKAAVGRAAADLLRNKDTAQQPVDDTSSEEDSSDQKSVTGNNTEHEDWMKGKDEDIDEIKKELQKSKGEIESAQKDISKPTKKTPESKGTSGETETSEGESPDEVTTEKKIMKKMETAATDAILKAAEQTNREAHKAGVHKTVARSVAHLAVKEAAEAAHDELHGSSADVDTNGVMV